MTAIAWTYATLTAALQNWLDDTDSDWTQGASPAINTLIQLGEMRLVNDFDLTVFDVQSTVNYTSPSTTGIVARPAGIIVTDDMGYKDPATQKFKTIQRRDYGWVLDYQDPAVTGPPVYWAESDTVNWVLAPFPDQTYALVVWGPFAPDSLIDHQASGTTWMSANLADVYLESCLLEAAKFLKNAQYRTMTKQVYDEKAAPVKVRMRALLRATTDGPRMFGAERPEGARPTHRQE